MVGPHSQSEGARSISVRCSIWFHVQWFMTPPVKSGTYKRIL